MVCLPYVRGITEPLKRLLGKNGINVATRPHKTLQQEFPSPKFRPPFELQTNVVYKIPCADYPWSYIGETGRCLSTREKEHIRNVKMCKTGSDISVHDWRNNHSIDINNARVIDKRNSIRIRKPLESWHTADTNEADNNSRPFPKQYSILLDQCIFHRFHNFFTLFVYIPSRAFIS